MGVRGSGLGSDANWDCWRVGGGLGEDVGVGVGRVGAPLGAWRSAATFGVGSNLPPQVAAGNSNFKFEARGVRGVDLFLGTFRCFRFKIPARWSVSGIFRMFQNPDSCTGGPFLETSGSFRIQIPARWSVSGNFRTFQNPDFRSRGQKLETSERFRSTITGLS